MSKTIFKKSLVTLGVCAALSAGGAQAGGILFDVNGSAGTNTTGDDRLNMTQIDWNVGNLLAINAIRDQAPRGAAAPVLVNMIGHAWASQFGGSSYNTANDRSDYTYQFGITMQQVFDGSNTITWAIAAPADQTVNFFRIYTSNTAASDSSVDAGLAGGQLFGCSNADGTQAASCLDTGGGAEHLVLEGRIGTTGVQSQDTATFQRTSASLGPMDASPPDQFSQVVSITGSSGNSPLIFKVDTFSFIDATYFPDGPQRVTLTIDPTNFSGPTLPFNTNPTPSKAILDQDLYSSAAQQNIYYGTDTSGGKHTNDYECNAATTVVANQRTCSFQMRTDADSTFNATPEPGVLALLGLGLGAFGFVGMRRRRT